MMPHKLPDCLAKPQHVLFSVRTLVSQEKKPSRRTSVRPRTSKNSTVSLRSQAVNDRVTLIRPYEMKNGLRAKWNEVDDADQNNKGGVFDPQEFHPSKWLALVTLLHHLFSLRFVSFSSSLISIESKVCRVLTNHNRFFGHYGVDDLAFRGAPGCIK